MMFKRNVISDSFGVQLRLGELGLSSDILREAILRGQGARNSCTPNDPAIAPGFMAWARTVRALRELLFAHGWVRNDGEALALVVNEPGTVAITVAAGDEWTALDGNGSPRTKYPKGPATAAVIEQNMLQTSLFPDDVIPIRKPLPVSNRVTWMLLISPAENEVRAELSLPALIGEDGHVMYWAERILLQPIPIEPIPGMDDDSETGESPDIDVPITRKGN